MVLSHSSWQSVRAVVARKRRSAELAQYVGLVVDDDKARRCPRGLAIADARDQVDRARQMAGELDPEQAGRETLCPGPQGIVVRQVGQDEGTDVSIGRRTVFLAP